MTALFRTFHITGGTTSTDLVELNPTYDFLEETGQTRINARTQGGQLNTYKLGGEYYRFTVPLTFVNSSKRSDLTKWWRNNDEVAFVFNASSNPETVVCGITNATQPLTLRSDFQSNLFDGILFLRSKRATITQLSGVFILNDQTLGLLDQNYNPLNNSEVITVLRVLGKEQGVPFILNHATWGLLNQSNIILT